MNGTKIEAGMAANTKNIQALVQTIRVLEARVDSLEEANHRLVAALQNLQADVANSKQLVAHVMGRGMGATTE